MTTTTPTKLTPRLNARLATYTAVTGAALAATVVTLPDARAAVVNSGPLNILIPVNSNGIYINLVTGASGTAAATTGWDINPYGSTSLSWFGATPAASSGYIVNFSGGSSATLVDNLPVGTPVTTGFTFGTINGSETTGTTAFNLNSSNNYVGFQFLNETTSTVNYGWAQVRLGATFTDATRAVISYGYENTGLPALVGVVPEPTTVTLLGVMATGALGVRAWRRRKAA